MGACAHGRSRAQVLAQGSISHSSERMVGVGQGKGVRKGEGRGPARSHQH